MGLSSLLILRIWGLLRRISLTLSQNVIFNGLYPHRCVTTMTHGAITSNPCCRTTFQTSGKLDPLYLLEAVQVWSITWTSCSHMIYSHTLRNNVHTLLTQDRDPRAYQIFLGNVIPSAEGQRDSSPSFLASTPERLYVRSGRRVASEAVAATRPRGAEGVGWMGSGAEYEHRWRIPLPRGGVEVTDLLLTPRMHSIL